MSVEVTERVRPATRSSKQRICIAVFFMLLGVAIIVKAVMTTHDFISYALGAVLILNGALRLRPGANS